MFVRRDFITQLNSYIKLNRFLLIQDIAQNAGFDLRYMLFMGDSDVLQMPL